MPLIKQLAINENTALLVWHITEQPDELYAIFSHRLKDESYTASQQNLHWLASRAAIAALFKQGELLVQKDENNKPSLTVDGNLYNLSITHSFHYAAVLISKMHRVAVDMEKYDQRIDRVKLKFASEKELQFAVNNNLLTKVWSAKETLYKYHSKKEVIFKTQLAVEPFTATDILIYGNIMMPDFTMRLPIQVLEKDGYCLTYIVQ